MNAAVEHVFTVESFMYPDWLRFYLRWLASVPDIDVPEEDIDTDESLVQMDHDSLLISHRALMNSNRLAWVGADKFYRFPDHWYEILLLLDDNGLIKPGVIERVKALPKCAICWESGITQLAPVVVNTPDEGPNALCPDHAFMWPQGTFTQITREEE